MFLITVAIVLAVAIWLRCGAPRPPVHPLARWWWRHRLEAQLHPVEEHNLRQARKILADQDLAAYEEYQEDDDEDLPWERQEVLRLMRQTVVDELNGYYDQQTRQPAWSVMQAALGHNIRDAQKRLQAIDAELGLKHPPAL